MLTIPIIQALSLAAIFEKLQLHAIHFINFQLFCYGYFLHLLILKNQKLFSLQVIDIIIIIIFPKLKCEIKYYIFLLNKQMDTFTGICIYWLTA